MSRKNKRKKHKRENRGDIRRKVNATVAAEFPGCVAEFSGGAERSRMATRGPTLGFRIKHVQTGKYRSNIIWVNPEYTGGWSAEWIHNAVNESNR